MDTRRLTTNAVCVALFVLLSRFMSVPLDVLGIKLTFESFPVIVAALLSGWADGLFVGALGSGIYQLMAYGFGPTTLLWMLPTMLRGVIVGLYAQKKGFALSGKQIAMIVLISSIVVTALNTYFLHIDGLIFGYATGLTLAKIALRFVSSVVMAAIYTLVCPQVVRLIRKSGIR